MKEQVVSNNTGSQWSSVYVHIPFCASRCIYCGFYSTVGSGLEASYVSALEQELSLRADYLPPDRPIRTIYLGGGTPSQLSPNLLERILRHVDKRIVTPRNHGLKVEETTIECNPDDVSEAFSQALYSLGVNRVSLGIQTFDDHRLLFLHRRHNASQAEEAIRRLRHAGIDNISIDLMFGFPGQTVADWERDIERALSLRPTHISAYGLTYEEGTPLEHHLREGLISAIDEETQRLMYDLLCDRLESFGYEHYEISNFALPGFRSRHNSGYWNSVPYLGLGAAAHSYDGNSRQWNVSNLKRYIQQISHGEVPMEREILDEQSRWNDLIVTAFRTCDGIDLRAVREEFGEAYLQFLLQSAQVHLEQDLLKIEEGALRLTRQGIHVSDMVMTDFVRVKG